MKNFSKFTVLLDLDDVLGQFEQAVYRLYAADWGLAPHQVAARCPRLGCYDMPNVLNVAPQQFCDRIESEGLSFWTEIEPTTWMENVVEMCLYYTPKVKVVTSPSVFTHASKGKHLWYLEHLARWNLPMFVTIDKTQHADSRLCLLVDDHTSNCEDFYNAGGSSLVFPGNGNDQYLHTGNLLHFQDQLEKKLDALQISQRERRILPPRERNIQEKGGNE